MNKLLTVFVFSLAVLTHGAADDAANAVSVILNNFGASKYSAGAIPKADLDRIIAAGVRAPSARNRQPWRFTVVSTPSLAEKIIGGVMDGNVLVVVSTDSDSPDKILDCALAVENIYLAAQALGYGSRIYTGPVNNINRSLKKELGIPQEHSAVSVVRLGRLAPNVDAVSSASPRKPVDSIVTYK
ncbi:MAG: nitroreductase family protein [Spirochaetaceae bacterium]|jgi:nitroreductase|nr:nitroreductase family protein [Spirochaetaceae bacterium]